MPIWIRLIKFTPEGLDIVKKDQAAILAGISQLIEEHGGKLRIAFASLAPFDALSIIECEDEEQLQKIDAAVAKQGLYTVQNFSAIPISDFISTITSSPMFWEAWLKAREQINDPVKMPETAIPPKHKLKK
ncbi:MAG: GYD domain-containing protein [Myxococcota bacterium]|nr:GYD domain-containing protein [Myxococcota bacterium]